jgi:hypothetical protein
MARIQISDKWFLRKPRPVVEANIHPCGYNSDPANPYIGMHIFQPRIGNQPKLHVTMTAEEALKLGQSLVNIARRQLDARPTT